MKKFSAGFQKTMEFILGMAGVIMILIETYSVFCRNITHWSTPWVDEILRLIFVWIVFIGAAVALTSDELISLTLIEDKFKEKGKAVSYNVLKVIQLVSVLVVALLLCQQEWVTMIGQISTGEATAITGYPVWIKSFGILLGFVMMAIVALVKLIGVCRNFKKLPE